MTFAQRRDRARREILDATTLIDIARRSVYGVPSVFLDRIELAVERLARLDGMEDPPITFQAAGIVQFPTAPAPLEAALRTREQGSR